MKLSFFTPTHDPRHIWDTYVSLLQQRGTIDWEWVIVPNGGCHISDIPADIAKDRHVKLVPCDLSGIGALKKFACAQCTGDVLVELDHDDQLCRTTFQELAVAHEREPGGFYYSDFTNIKPDGTCETYGKAYGWESYQCEINGNPYVASKAFPPTARALSQIYYAPNHIRAWSRKAYDKSGGYDAALMVGDDHDLLCRTYIADVPFVWIQKPLYIYRRHAGNSFIAHNKKIQVQQTANFNKYLHELVLAEVRRNKTLAIDIGRKEWCPKAYTSIDVVEGGQTKLWSLSNSVGVIRANDVLQRIPTAGIVSLFNLFYDMLVPGGWILSATPSIDDGRGNVGRGAFQDPSHISYWSENNFWYFTDKKYGGMLSGFKGKFQDVRIATTYPTEWHEKNVIPYVVADLCALKGQRQPGVKKW